MPWTLQPENCSAARGQPSPNPMPLSIGSFEGVQGRHPVRQSHRKSNRQSAGRHPEYNRENVGASHPVSFRQIYRSLFAGNEQSAYPILLTNLSPSSGLFQGGIKVGSKQFPQFIGHQQILLSRLLIITHRNQEKHFQGIMGSAGRFYHRSITTRFEELPDQFQFLHAKLFQYGCRIWLDVGIDFTNHGRFVGWSTNGHTKESGNRNSDSLWTRSRLLRYVNEVMVIVFLWEM